jgi:hypothetical protein
VRVVMFVDDDGVMWNEIERGEGLGSAVIVS